MSFHSSGRKRRSWRKAVNNPAYFARNFLNFYPHPGQLKWLSRSFKSENALVTGNRWGKSQIQAVKIIHRALFQIRPAERDVKGYYRCANVSISQDQAGIIFSKAVDMISRSDALKPLIKEIRQTPFPHIVLKMVPRYGPGRHTTGANIYWVTISITSIMMRPPMIRRANG